MSDKEVSELDYPDYVRSLRADDPALVAELAGFNAVEDVLKWMERRGLCKSPVDIVGQDEFSYDFLIGLDPQRRWLAFGVN